MAEATYDDVLAAAGRIAPYAVRTPLVESPALSTRIGGRVFLKLELLQRTGSFKFRGALNRLAMIPPEKRGGGVVVFSSGNHAQGVAAAAGLFGMTALIVMPADAPRAKIEGTRAMGAAARRAVAAATTPTEPPPSACGPCKTARITRLGSPAKLMDEL